MRIISLSILSLCLVSSAAAQKINKPKLTPSVPTEAQQQLIQEGTRLHDQKKYDEAILLYQGVLAECSACPGALYEMGLSYYMKKDFTNALKYFEEATKYIGPLRAKAIRMIGSVVDDRGDRKQALEIYAEALKLSPNDAILHYDIGVTLARMSRFEEARKSLKKSVELDPLYVSSHYILAEVFIRTKYRVPAMLAAARVLTLESGTARSKRAAEIFMSVFQGNTKKDEKTGNLNIFLNLDGPEDEGDFGSIELVLGLGGAVEETEENKNKTDEEKFVSRLRTFMAIAGETKMKSNFTKDQYFTFLEGVKKQDFVEAFAYLLMHQDGNKKAEAWVNANGQKMLDFLTWSGEFRP